MRQSAFDIHFENPLPDAQISPSEGRTTGGAIILVGVTGFCRNTLNVCPAEPFSAILSANGTTQTANLETFGYVSLRQWDERGSAYSGLVGKSDLADYLAVIGQQTRNTFDQVLGAVRQTVLASSDGSVSDTDSFLIFMRLPQVRFLLCAVTFFPCHWSCCTHWTRL